jgi:hypothetical protein
MGDDRRYRYALDRLSFSSSWTRITIQLSPALTGETTLRSNLGNHPNGRLEKGPAAADGKILYEAQFHDVNPPAVWDGSVS